MRILSTIISFALLFGIKFSVAIFECHPHKVICDKNCDLRYGGMSILIKMCRAACSVSQCLVKNKNISIQGNAEAAINNKETNNPSFRPVNASYSTDTPIQNVPPPVPVKALK
ncbi:hypothetical protein BMR1_03g02893 [Babesia microti strain RI]|uniref:Uncharacterized protein n=1 Tax=Babesia microti (strain RI) TaxID=1133968 RepID=A0A1R4ABY0_BABMR|nr:hypothetical protein BMR1_03g02893 [Babesia microti strain RI]SJK86517.1 hypothetical protein BMR1_03g02893 [Babesia microti strain RI]|eukprot:XP_021338667.1 hypothetical protein BMR1_03g02893 [Babesia microti strain RI]